VEGRSRERADEVIWALQIWLPRAERATEALELEKARSAERAAALRYMAGSIQLFVVVGLANRKRKASGMAGQQCQLTQLALKKLDRSRRVEIKGIHPENDLSTKSTAWVFREGTNKNIQK
jgi:hypothetical protein